MVTTPKKDRHLEEVPKPTDRGAGAGLAAGKRRTTFVITEYWDEQVEREASRQNTNRSQVYLRAIAEYFDNHYGDVSTLDLADDSDDLYDPNKFYTASQDKRGHSFHLRVNIPKPLAGEAGAFVQSGRVPAFRSIEDIARNGFYHCLKQVAMKYDAGELETAVDLAMLNAEELAIMEREQQAEDLLENIRANIQRMVGRHEWNGLRRYLTEREGYADSLPSPFREELIEVVADARKKVGRQERRSK